VEDVDWVGIEGDLRGDPSGGAENAGLENAGVAKMQGWKTRE